MKLRTRKKRKKDGAIHLSTDISSLVEHKGKLYAACEDGTIWDVEEGRAREMKLTFLRAKAS